jgi:hypothetical protein
MKRLTFFAIFLWVFDKKDLDTGGDLITDPQDAEHCFDIEVRWNYSAWHIQLLFAYFLHKVPVGVKKKNFKGLFVF